MGRAAVIPFLFCLAPLAATGWRGWRLVTTAALAIYLALAGYGGWLIADMEPEMHGYAFAMIASLVLASGVALAAGAVGRLAGLRLQERGRSRAGVLWTDLLALTVPAVFLFLVGAI